MAFGAGVATNAQGEFRLDQLPSGSYYLRVDPPGPSIRRSNESATTAVRTYFAGTPDREAAVSVSAVAGGVVRLADWHLAFVDAFHVAGRVVDETGRGLPDVMLRLVDGTSLRATLPFRVERALTNAEGAFRLDGVVAGEYLLVAVPPRRSASTATTATPTAESYSFVLGGSRPEAARGSVWTESKDGVTVQYRDEFAVTQRVTITNDSVTGVTLVVRQPAQP